MVDESREAAAASWPWLTSLWVEDTYSTEGEGLVTSESTAPPRAEVLPLQSPASEPLASPPPAANAPLVDGIDELLQEALAGVQMRRARAERLEVEARRCREAVQTLQKASASGGLGTAATTRVAARLRPRLAEEADMTVEDCVRVCGPGQLEVVTPQSTAASRAARRRSTGGIFEAVAGDSSASSGLSAGSPKRGMNRGGVSRSFNLDMVFDSQSSDDEVFAALLREDALATLDGEAVCVLMCGASSSGKSHTMSALAARAAEELERHAEARLAAEPHVRVGISLQVLEVGGDAPLDLLAGSEDGAIELADSSFSLRRLSLPQPGAGLVIRGATTWSLVEPNGREAGSASSSSSSMYSADTSSSNIIRRANPVARNVVEALQHAEAQRLKRRMQGNRLDVTSSSDRGDEDSELESSGGASGSSARCAATSSSHVLATLIVSVFGGSDPCPQKVGTLTLVDLAPPVPPVETLGSCQMKLMNSHEESFVALADVLLAKESKAGSAPYQSSLLTQLLQESMDYAAGCRTLLLLTISPCCGSQLDADSSSGVEQTIRALQFGAKLLAARARNTASSAAGLAAARRFLSQQEQQALLPPPEEDSRGSTTSVNYLRLQHEALKLKAQLSEKKEQIKEFRHRSCERDKQIAEARQNVDKIGAKPAQRLAQGVAAFGLKLQQLEAKVFDDDSQALGVLFRGSSGPVGFGAGAVRSVVPEPRPELAHRPRSPLRPAVVRGRALNHSGASGRASDVCPSGLSSASSSCAALSVVSLGPAGQGSIHSCGKLQPVLRHSRSSGSSTFGQSDSTVSLSKAAGRNTPTRRPPGQGTGTPQHPASACSGAQRRGAARPGRSTSPPLADSFTPCFGHKVGASAAPSTENAGALRLRLGARGEAAANGAVQPLKGADRSKSPAVPPFASLATPQPSPLTCAADTAVPATAPTAVALTALESVAAASVAAAKAAVAALAKQPQPLMLPLTVDCRSESAVTPPSPVATLPTPARNGGRSSRQEHRPEGEFREVGGDQPVTQGQQHPGGMVSSPSASSTCSSSSSSSSGGSAPISANAPAAMVARAACQRQNRPEVRLNLSSVLSSRPTPAVSAPSDAARRSSPSAAAMPALVLGATMEAPQDDGFALAPMTARWGAEASIDEGPPTLSAHRMLGLSDSRDSRRFSFANAAPWTARDGDEEGEQAAAVCSPQSCSSSATCSSSSSGSSGSSTNIPMASGAAMPQISQPRRQSPFAVPSLNLSGAVPDWQLGAVPGTSPPLESLRLPNRDVASMPPETSRGRASMPPMTARGRSTSENVVTGPAFSLAEAGARSSEMLCSGPAFTIEEVASLTSSTSSLAQGERPAASCSTPQMQYQSTAAQVQNQGGGVQPASRLSCDSSASSSNGEARTVLRGAAHLFSEGQLDISLSSDEGEIRARLQHALIQRLAVHEEGDAGYFPEEMEAPPHSPSAPAHNAGAPTVTPVSKGVAPLRRPRGQEPSPERCQRKIAAHLPGAAARKVASGTATPPPPPGVGFGRGGAGKSPRASSPHGHINSPVAKKSSSGVLPAPAVRQAPSIRSRVAQTIGSPTTRGANSRGCSSPSPPPPQRVAGAAPRAPTKSRSPPPGSNVARRGGLGALARLRLGGS